MEKTSNGLHIEDTSGRAVVLAVISQRPYDWIDSPSPRPFFLEMEEEFGERLCEVPDTMIDVDRL